MACRVPRVRGPIQAFLVLGALLVLAPAVAPAPPRTGPAGGDAAVSDPDPEDVESIDAILAALYDVISGPAGETRDWDRFRALFLPEGRLMPAGVGEDGSPTHRAWTPEDYVARSGPILKERGFFESEIGRVTERFGNIAHVFSAYESRRTPEDPEPFQRGINSIQLFHDGDRWWVVTIMWDWEREGNLLPDRYLKGGGSER